jgi:glycosyltransferase involved in cell wall biosynthesis
MKILLVHNFYQQFGGEDAAAWAERDLLQKNGHEVISYTRHNDELKSIGSMGQLLLAPSMVYSRRTARELRELVRARRPDVAYIHNFFPLISPSVYYTLQDLGVPVVQVMHDFRFFCPNGWFFTRGNICERCKAGNYLNAVRFRCYRNSLLPSLLAATIVGSHRLSGVLSKISAFLCLTEFSRQKLLEIGIPPERVFVRPHFLDASSFVPNFRSDGYALFLGRLSSEKGVWTLVRAFEQLVEAPLKIVGTGPLEGALRDYVAGRNLGHIEILGFREGAEKHKLIRNSSLLVVPSEWYETFCLVVLESYAAGKPVVASNLGSLPHVVENGKSGLLFKAGDDRDLRAKVSYLLARPDEAASMGSYGRGLLLSRYSPENSYRTLMNIFSSLAGSRATQEQDRQSATRQQLGRVSSPQ